MFFLEKTAIRSDVIPQKTRPNTPINRPMYRASYSNRHPMVISAIKQNVGRHDDGIAETFPGLRKKPLLDTLAPGARR
jgi:hypothetical protein